MKKILFVLGLSAFLFSSCGSKPKTDDGVSQKIESDISEAVEETKETVEEVKENIELTDNSEILDSLNSAREAALSAGCESLCPEQFSQAESLYKTLEPQAKAGANLGSALDDLKARYEAMEKYSQSLKLKSQIEENAFQSYDNANYEKANSIVESFTDSTSLSNISGKAMNEKIDGAYKAYKTVIFKAFREKAKVSRTEAFKSKQNADSVKAGVAEKSEYAKAVEEFKSGDASFSIQNPEGALNHYENAKVQFESLYQSVKEKREAAQKAMDEAKKLVEESKNYAENADVESPLEGENIQGIEKQDAVLLEEEKFEDPKNAEAQIAEDIEIPEEQNLESKSENVILQLEDKINESGAKIEDAVNEAESFSQNLKETLEEAGENSDNSEAK